MKENAIHTIAGTQIKKKKDFLTFNTELCSFNFNNCISNFTTSAFLLQSNMNRIIFLIIIQAKCDTWGKIRYFFKFWDRHKSTRSIDSLSHVYNQLLQRGSPHTVDRKNMQPVGVQGLDRFFVEEVFHRKRLKSE